MMSVADIKKNLLSSCPHLSFVDETVVVLRPSEMIKSDDPSQRLNVIVESDADESDGAYSDGDTSSSRRGSIILSDDSPLTPTGRRLAASAPPIASTSSFKRRSTRPSSLSFHPHMLQMIFEEWLASVPWKVFLNLLCSSVAYAVVTVLLLVLLGVTFQVCRNGLVILQAWKRNDFLIGKTDLFFIIVLFVYIYIIYQVVPWRVCCHQQNPCVRNPPVPWWVVSPHASYMLHCILAPTREMTSFLRKKSMSISEKWKSMPIWLNWHDRRTLIF